MRGVLLSLAALAGLVALSAVTASGQPRRVELRGKLRTGIVAIGGESTGTVLVTDQGRFELDLGSDPRLRQVAGRLDTKAVVVTGTVVLRKGVEVGERRMVYVRSLEPAGDRPATKAGQEQVPLTREALLGKWQGRCRDATVRVWFQRDGAEVRIDRPEGGGVTLDTSYRVDHEARMVRIGGLGQGRLVAGDRLRLTVASDGLPLPQGATVMLNRMTPKGPK